MLPVMRRNSWLPEVFNDFFDTDFMPKAHATAPAINVIESDNEAGLKILENLNDEDEVQTDASTKAEDQEIVDYSNYQPTEPKEEDVEADEKESLADDVDEDKIYKD